MYDSAESRIKGFPLKHNHMAIFNGKSCSIVFYEQYGLNEVMCPDVLRLRKPRLVIFSVRKVGFL